MIPTGIARAFAIKERIVITGTLIIYYKNRNSATRGRRTKWPWARRIATLRVCSARTSVLTTPEASWRVIFTPLGGRGAWTRSVYQRYTHPWKRDSPREASRRGSTEEEKIRQKKEDPPERDKRGTHKSEPEASEIQKTLIIKYKK